MKAIPRDPHEARMEGQQMANRLLRDLTAPKERTLRAANMIGEPRQPSLAASASVTAPGQSAENEGLAPLLAASVAREIRNAGGVGHDQDGKPLPLPVLRQRLNGLPRMDPERRIELKNKLDRYAAGLLL
jgi:hypothetical protein